MSPFPSGSSCLLDSEQSGISRGNKTQPEWLGAICLAVTEGLNLSLQQTGFPQPCFFFCWDFIMEVTASGNDGFLRGAWQTSRPRETESNPGCASGGFSPNSCLCPLGYVMLPSAPFSWLSKWGGCGGGRRKGVLHSIAACQAWSQSSSQWWSKKEVRARG